MKVLIFTDMSPGFDHSKLPEKMEGGRYRNLCSYHAGDSVEVCDFWSGDAPKEYRDKYPEYIEAKPEPEVFEPVVKEKKPRKKKTELSE